MVEITKDVLLKHSKDKQAGVVNGKPQRKNSKYALTQLRTETLLSIDVLTTELYIKGEDSLECLRLQRRKDELCSIKENPFNMDLETNQNAKIQNDYAKRITRKSMFLNGKFVKICARQPSPQQVYFLDIITANDLINKEKNADVKKQMQDRYAKFIKMPKAESYGELSP